MTPEIAQILVNFIEDQGYEAIVYEGYSGRGMYGEETTGIDTEIDPRTLKELLEDNDNDVLEALSNFRWDSLGLGYILY